MRSVGCVCRVEAPHLINHPTIAGFCVVFSLPFHEVLVSSFCERGFQSKAAAKEQQCLMSTHTDYKMERKGANEEISYEDLEG